ncbi:MAG: hypothetical protein U1E93_08955 [Alphaproteobacteria bacterium]
MTAHRKLVSLLCFLLLASGSLVLLAVCGGFFPPQQAAAAPFQNYDQVTEAYGQVVPGMTQAQDLANLGFDTAHVEILSPSNIARRFAGPDHANPVVQACIRAADYCTGYAFHPGRKPTGLARIAGGHWSADVVLLVMNGRVVHKVFSA